MSSRLGNGYKPVDKTTIRGRLKNASPLDKGLRSLLVKDTAIRNEKEAEEKTKPPIGKVKSLSDIISNNIQASNDLRTITHYIKRAEQIWTTLLLKPNGDQPDLLIYDSQQSDVKNAKLHELLLTVVKNHFTTKYPFEEIIPQIIKDVLFRTGSYALVHLSHSVLDHLINGMEVPYEKGERKPDGTIAGNEHFQSITESVLAKHFVGGNWGKALNLGYIRKERNANPGNFIGFESLYGSSNREPEYNLVDDRLKWTFTDNPMVIKAGELAQRMREDRLRQMSGSESLDNWINNRYVKKKGGKKKTNNNNLNIVSKQTLEEDIKGMYPDRNYDQNETLTVRKGKFYSGNGRGIGISYHWPSEAIINVCLNGEVGKPFGHILLTDPETGEPLKNTSDVKYYQKAKGAGETSDKPMTGSMNEIISHIRQVAAGNECEHDMGWMVELASANLEKEFIEGLLNGDLKKDVTISLTEENKKLYMSRALRDQGVRAIFVPAEYVTYIAIDFSKLGVGRSLIDEAKLHITRLAVLDTADALAQVENSISHTLMTIDPESEDFDIRNTVAMVRDEYFANNPTLHDILGYNNVSIDAVLDRFKEQTLTVKVNPGDNPNMVTPQIEAQQMNREPLKSIDRDTREGLLNTISGMFGLKRSWMDDTGEGNDFAVEALAEQELLRNQTNDYSRTFSRFFTDTMRKYMRVNEPLIGELIDVIKENKKLYMKPDQTGELELDDELKEKLSAESDEDDDISPEEMDIIKVVLTDFLNTFFVTLPTPAITDSLNKLDDKLQTVEKLVANWLDLGGGSDMLKARATEAGMDADAVIGSIKAVILNEAFQRFNLPMPFESILNDGSNGGILNMVNNAADLENNVLRFLQEWLKGTKKNRTMLERLKAKVDKEEGIGGGEEVDPSLNPEEGNEYDIDNLPEVDQETPPEETPPEETPPEENPEEEVQSQTTEEQEVESQGTEEGTAPSDSADDIWGAGQ